MPYTGKKKLKCSLSFHSDYAVCKTDILPLPTYKAGAGIRLRQTRLFFLYFFSKLSYFRQLHSEANRQAMTKDILFRISLVTLRAPDALALLVGDTPNPGKNRLRSFADTPCGVSFMQTAGLHFSRLPRRKRHIFITGS